MSSRPAQAGAPGEYPYSYTTAPRFDDGNDGNGSHHDTGNESDASSMEGRQEEASRIRHARTTSDAALISPITGRMDGPPTQEYYQSVTWSPSPQSPEKELPAIPPFSPISPDVGGSSSQGQFGTLGASETPYIRYPSPGLDSLLEPPYLSEGDLSHEIELRDQYRQRAALEALGGGAGNYSGDTIDSPDWKKKEKRRSMTTAFGEKAFKGPILGVQKKTMTTKLDPHQVIDQRSELVAEWGIYWYLPVLTVAAFLAGLIGALGHHWFYRSLHGQKSVQQLMMVRIGTAFAFFVKACLVGAVVLAYRQRIWYTMRRKALSIRTIDAMFGVVEDPTFFFTSPQMIKRSKISSLLALATWLIPIASVLSPSSLTSENILVTKHTTCNVPTLDFPAENQYDYRTAKEDFGNALSFYNHTDPNDTKTDLAYDMPSYMNLLVTSKSVYNHGTVSPNTTPCPDAFNCTYTIEVEAPGYKCDDLVGQTPIWDRAPFNMESLVPDGRFVYRAEVDQGDFQKPDLRPTDPDFDPDWITGTFHYEPEIWIAFASKTNVSLTPEEAKQWQETVNGTSRPRWKNRFEPRMFRCTLYYTNYTLEFDYLDNKQNITVLKTNYTRPVMETLFGVNPPDRAKFMRPSNPNYRLTAAYHSIAQLMRGYLRGAIYQDNDRDGEPGSIPITNSTISLTNLVDSTTAYPLKQLDQKIQEFLQDIIFTLMTTSKKMVVTKQVRVPCKATRYENRFQYHEKNLWIGYSIVVVVTFVAIIVGGIALRENGISSDTLFSRILVTTRNPTLDRLARGACLGGDPFPKELEQTKLRFGVLKEIDPFTGSLVVRKEETGVAGGRQKTEHCAFGTIYETSDIIKGGKYAGLPEDWGRVRRSEGGRNAGGCGCGGCRCGDDDADSGLGEFYIEEDGEEVVHEKVWGPYRVEVNGEKQLEEEDEEEEEFYDFDEDSGGMVEESTMPLLGHF